MVFGFLTQARMASNGMFLVDGQTGESSKVDRFLELLDELRDQGRKVVVFSGPPAQSQARVQRATAVVRAPEAGQCLSLWFLVSGFWFLVAHVLRIVDASASRQRRRFAMGDRGNIYFVDSESDGHWAGLYMYAHWLGSALPSIVRSALERGSSRWGDSQYLARIVFCELVQTEVLDEIGYGLGTQLGDNEHLIVRVNDLDQTVSYHQPGTERARDGEVASWSYQDFLAAPIEDLMDRFDPHY